MLTIRLLGQFSLVLDGETLDLPSRPAQSLLAWLVLHPGIAHRREQIAGLLWPAVSDATAHSNLRHVLWRLRRTVPESFLYSDRIVIRWENGGDWQTDVRLFCAGAESATNTEALLAGLDAYSDELLPGFYDEWIVLERERLAALFDSASAHLLELLVAAQRWREAIDRAERWIARGGIPEPAYRTLMHAHAGLGNSAAALAAYQRCITALDRELGVPPSAETEALADAIRVGAFPVRGAGGVSSHPLTSSPRQPAIPAHLPAPLTPFVGREQELAALADLLTDPAHRLITVVGPGGMGKTRLALAAAQAQTNHFPDGCVFVPLAGVNGPEDIFSAVATSLHFAFQEEQRTPQQQIIDFLRGQRILLLLDNFEHLLEGVPFLVALLQAASAVKLLVTSRERLRLTSETLLGLDGLGVPADESTEYRPGQYSAVDLFVQTATRLRRDFADDVDFRSIVRICRLVGGLPLGVVLAASSVDVLTPGEIAVALEGNLELLQTDLRDFDLRHRSVVAVLDQSWRQFSAEEQRTLQALSVFSGGFDREAAHAVAAATLPILTRLIHRSWLGLSEAGRYNLHEVIRQFARMKLRQAGHESAICSRHCAFYAGRIAQYASRLHTDQRHQALAAIATDQANGLVAWEWATTSRDAQRLVEMCDGLAAHFLQSGLYAYGEQLFGRAIEALQGGEATILQRIRLLLRQTHFCVQQGRREAGRRAQEEASRHLFSTGIRADDCLWERGVALFWDAHLSGDTDGTYSQQKFSRALHYFRACHDTHWIVRSLLALGWGARRTDDREQMQSLVQEAVAISRANGDLDALAGALELLAFAAIEEGAMGSAEQYLTESLSARQGAGIAGEIARAWRNRGVLSLLQGRFTEAESQLAEASTRYTRLGQQSGLVYTTIWQGMAQLHLGNNMPARHWGERGLAHAREFGHQGVIANGLLLLGSIALAEGEDDEARRLLEEAVAGYASRSQKHEMAIALSTLAYAQHRLQGVESALASIRRGMALVLPRAFYPKAMAAPLVAHLLQASGMREQATELHATIAATPYLINSRWFATIALDRLADLLAPVPADVRAAAAQRGQAQGLPQLTGELLALL